MNIFHADDIPSDLAGWFEPVPQIGLEPSPDLYVRHLTEIFREVRRVLHPSGVVWLNLGDSYAGSGKGGIPDKGKQGTNAGSMSVGRLYPDRPGESQKREACENVCRASWDDAGIKPKDLIGIPWAVAFALRADGWWLRSDVVWAKQNSMPESVEDRPTRSHEFVFLLSKSARYFYDRFAIREPFADARLGNPGAHKPNYLAGSGRGDSVSKGQGWDRGAELGGRNSRDVWFLSSEPTAFGHFAVMPSVLAERCVLAGASAGGACASCGALWVRQLGVAPDDRQPMPYSAADQQNAMADGAAGNRAPKVARANGGSSLPARRMVHRGYAPACDCVPIESRPCVVLDPFAGSGTVMLAARKYGLDFVGIELNPEYATLARGRLGQQPAEEPVGGKDLPLFARRRIGT